MTKKRDVLFLCQFFYPTNISSGILPFQTAKHLAKEGKKVDVITGYQKDKKNLARQEEIDGVFIKRVRYLNLDKRNSIKRLVSYISFVLSMFFQVFKFKKYKIIIVYSNPPILPIIAILGRKLYGCKVIFISYDVYPEIAIELNVIKKNGVVSRLMFKLNNWIFKSVNCVVALSEDMKNFLITNRNISQQDVEVISNWATENYSLPEKENISELFIELKKENELIISYLGNMGKAQDIETIIKLMSQDEIINKKIKFLFAGHGEKKKDLIEFSKNHTNVIVFDFLEGDEFNTVLQFSDLFVVSLNEGLEGLAMPSKTYSYIQAEKPIIAIMDSGMELCSEIEAYNLGIAVENGDYKFLVNFILNIYENKHILKELQQNVKRIHSKKYNKKNQLNQYNELVNKLIREN